MVDADFVAGLFQSEVHVPSPLGTPLEQLVLALVPLRGRAQLLAKAIGRCLTHREKNMGVRVVWIVVMDADVRDHAARCHLVLHEVSNERDLLL